MPRNTSKSIFISIPTEQRDERLKFEGVLAYAHEKNGAKWRLQTDPGGLLPRIIRNYQSEFDGFIVYVTNEKIRKQLARIDRPIVLIEDLEEPSHHLTRPNATTLVIDHFEEGRSAARFFLDRHFKNFAWVDQSIRTVWADLRRKGFCSTLARHGFSVHTYPFAANEPKTGFADEIVMMSKWLDGLPRPCAIFVSRDARARQVISAAVEAGIPMPESLAILGIDNDEMTDTTISPSLSSIDPSSRIIGYTAGRLLNELILKPQTGRVIRLHHPRIVKRRSTEADAVEDQFVRKVLDYARRHLTDDLSATALGRLVGLPAHALRLRTEKSLGITLGREIQRIRLSEAFSQLTGTDKSVDAIASECGFASTSHLSLRTKEAYHQTPLKLRQTFLLKQGHGSGETTG